MTWNLVIAGILIVLSASFVSGILGASSGDSAIANVEATATVESTATPEPTRTATPAPANRSDCKEIRGTDYLSRAERQWFLANCVTSQ